MDITTTEVGNAGEGHETRFDVTPGSWGAEGGKPAGSAGPGTERDAGFAPTWPVHQHGSS